MLLVFLIVSIFYFLLGVAVCLVCGYPVYVGLILAVIFTVITVVGVKALERMNFEDIRDDDD